MAGTSRCRAWASFSFLRAQGTTTRWRPTTARKPCSRTRNGQPGIPTRPEQVIVRRRTTGVRRHYAPGTPVYVIGEAGIRQALAEAGFPEDPAAARLVVVGLDFGLTYDMLKTATLRINAGADFIGTNGDLTFPLPEGIAPGNGSVLAALQAATGVKPLVIGKPEVAMFEVAVERLGVEPGQVVMIGDRLETDILGAQRAGLKTILVLSGVVSAARRVRDSGGCRLRRRGRSAPGVGAGAGIRVLVCGLPQVCYVLGECLFPGIWSRS